MFFVDLFLSIWSILYILQTENINDHDVFLIMVKKFTGKPLQYMYIDCLVISALVRLVISRY